MSYNSQFRFSLGEEILYVAALQRQTDVFFFLRLFNVIWSFFLTRADNTNLETPVFVTEEWSL